MKFLNTFWGTLYSLWSALHDRFACFLIPTGFPLLSIQGYFYHQKLQDEVRANPFVQTPGGNNSFTPQRIGSKQPVSLLWFLFFAKILYNLLSLRQIVLKGKCELRISYHKNKLSFFCEDYSFLYTKHLRKNSIRDIFIHFVAELHF